MYKRKVFKNSMDESIQVTGKGELFRRNNTSNINCTCLIRQSSCSFKISLALNIQVSKAIYALEGVLATAAAQSQDRQTHYW